jgi:hypothetical protein
MKSLKAICMATLLALVLSVPAYAGDINTPGAPTPPGSGQTTNPVTSDPNTASGDLDSPGFPELLLALLSLF